jgi:hypothetical protein
MPGDLAPDRRNLRVSHEDRDQIAEQLRVAAGDGRLTADELDERLESALTARTYGELEALVADLPAAAGGGLRPAAAAQAKDLIELKINHGVIKRDGPWVVPRRLTVEARHGNVVLDFSAAVITAPTLDLDITLGHGNMVLIAPATVVVDVDSVTAGHGVIRQRVKRQPGDPVRLTVTVTGSMRHGNFVVRSTRTGPRRTFWQWLLGRPPAPLAELPYR